MCSYKFSAGNGVDPNSFISRPVADEILSTLPQKWQEVASDPTATIRVLIYGSPGSGKSSILGYIHHALQKRYQGKPVFFLRAAEIKDKVKQIQGELLFQQECVVVIDDAHVWYEEEQFWALFKGTHRIFVAASTYAVSSMNPATPVDVQKKYSSVLRNEEKERLFINMGVPEQHRDQLFHWFGASFGRLQLLVPDLLLKWGTAKETVPTLTLSDFYFRASTLQAMAPQRFMPALSDEMKDQLFRFLRGQITDEAKQKLVRYGVLANDGDWSCDFVCRWYFTALFQANDRSQWSTNCPQNNFPSTVELLRKGLAELEWATIQKCGDSSKSGFPIEDIWQTAFYAAIGGFIPSSFSFCKEKVTSNDKRIDFVLRNGSKWGIEFLIKSSKVEEHHSRFECGGSY